MAGTVLYKLVL